jgi:type IV pilus assembly protein PilC
MNKISLNEQAYFASRLAFLVNAEIPMADSILMLRAQSKNKKEKDMLDKIYSDICNGSFLSKSLENIKPKFSNLSIQIIKTGEMTGNLGSNLVYVSQELKKRQILFQKIVGALFYPMCIGVATIGVTGMITLYILPKITPIFSSLKTSLPLSTKILISFHYFFTKYWWLVFIFFFLFFASFIFVWKKNEKFRLFIQNLYLKIPVFGQMFRYYEVIQTFRTLSLLLRSDVVLKDSIQIIYEGCSVDIYKKEYKTLSENVIKGLPMSVFLASNKKLFPIMVGQMISVGESSGNLIEVSSYISEYYERELDEIIKKLNSMLEPILMVVMGLVVGFVAISVITPIYQITQNIKR